MLANRTNEEPPSATPEPADAVLVARALGGSEDAFARLIERYRPLLWGIAWRMALDADDARDICQEVVIRLWRALPRYRPEQPLAPWLRVLAAREALRWLRRHRSGTNIIPLEELSGELEAIPGPADCAPERLAEADRRQAIAEAIAALSPQQRTAVTLRFHEEMALSEIAEAMECSEGSVKQHLFRAMDKLRKLLKKGRLS